MKLSWRLLGSTASVLVSLATTLWVSVRWEQLEAGLILWSLLMLWRYNLPRDHRYRQWPSAIGALLWTVACELLLLKLRTPYLGFLVTYSAPLAWLDQTLSIRLPGDVGHFVLLGNAACLGVFALFKCVFVMIVREIRPSPASRGAVIWRIAYMPSPPSWGLKPGWLYARWLSTGAALVGFATLLAAWLIHGSQVAGIWLPLMPAGLFLVMLEWALWLSGPVNEKWRPEFLGSDANALTVGNFDELWRRYRLAWKSRWLAAGNRLPGTNRHA
ncbi:MAG: hypothetical protein ACT4PZ_11215 [Panacagrimonas sp.]